MNQSTTESRGGSLAGAVALVCLAFLPALLAVLPLTFNGAQYTLGALGRAELPEGASPSLGWGLALLGAAVLPFLAGPGALVAGRAKGLSWERALRVCAWAVLGCGLFACLMAMMSAGV
ncbi:hypothetical protein [Streptomyces clavuligerus]|nr:hypothetical protein [Streptomyces clavuligerus]WDN56383.1 hypothetical protein LL058_31570 [Streptomyces clavuligerus]